LVPQTWLQLLQEEEAMNPFAEDLKSFIATGRTMIEELMDEAVSGNITRFHHLEAAIDAFNQAGKVMEALIVAQDFLNSFEGVDEPPASQDESSDNTHDASHTSR
jgi:hypothetical protein